ncbi:MAG: hypothetical protein J6V87_03615 [Prevotella sp.]|nr:hypothetical protein [Prevotella sp.]
MKKKTILMVLALLCSFVQGAWGYTVTIYEAAASGLEYGEPKNSGGIDGVGFLLGSPDTPAYMKFKGWLVNPSTPPTSWEYVDDEDLKSGGTIIMPDGDVTVYARYEYVYGTAWTWASDYRSATVKITSLEYPDDIGVDINASSITSEITVEPSYDEPGQVTYTATVTMMRTGDNKVFTFTDSKTLWLVFLGEGNNTTMLGKSNGKEATVHLTNRTLYKNGNWNTLCLPFDLALEGSPLNNASLKEFSSASFANGTMTLNFTDASSIEAGKPYLIKWDKPNDYDGHESDYDLDPSKLVFRGVTVNSTVNDTQCSINDGQSVTFMGTYTPKSIAASGDPSLLYLGAGNTLYYPNAAMTIASQRAYFQLTGISAGNLPSLARTFVLDFGDSENTTGIVNVEANTTLYTHHSSLKDSWYDLQGRCLKGKPTAKGLYINNGVKVIIK